ncbi:hypothetical protein WICPIJ_009924 [Wickerhamomyces pijperi]|uniref:Uncharacterized protein n=1 Tax=Wickerhamomyces pijperi TaxID=599730 RepID=A0A9P8TB36_WICPI|nr:hypothetical protein WICPIJ_009924 [Wickerhamomyces pijperi]
MLFIMFDGSICSPKLWNIRASFNWTLASKTLSYVERALGFRDRWFISFITTIKSVIVSDSEIRLADCLDFFTSMSLSSMMVVSTSLEITTSFVLPNSQRN